MAWLGRAGQGEGFYGGIKMRLLNTWKFYAGIIILGFVVWIIAGLFSIPKPELYEMQKGLSGPGSPMASIPSSKMFYPELKFWFETTGKILVGAGGVAGSIKALLDLFRRKQ